MSDNQIKHITKCRICGKEFLNWQMDIPIIGQPPAERARQFVLALAGHLAKKHPEKMQAIQLGGQEFMGMLIMMLFDSADPNLRTTTEHARAAVCAVARPMPVTNQQLDEMVSGFGLALSPSISSLLQAVRDRCFEIGQYDVLHLKPPVPAA